MGKVVEEILHRIDVQAFQFGRVGRADARQGGDRRIKARSRPLRRCALGRRLGGRLGCRGGRDGPRLAQRRRARLGGLECLGLLQQLFDLGDCVGALGFGLLAILPQSVGDLVDGRGSSVGCQFIQDFLSPIVDKGLKAVDDGFVLIAVALF